jgi:membrane protein YqaA with SNARE-associated domain
MQDNNQDSGKSRSKIKELYYHYKERGLYRYVGWNVLKIIFFYAIFILILYFVGKYLLDYNKIFQYFLERLSDRFTLILFFISESFLGLVPVDLFVLWTLKFESPIVYLAILGVLSYAGGIISYFIGLWISRRPKIRIYTEKRLRNYIEFVRKWGGAFIVVAALFPFTPFSMVVIALTLLRYPFKPFLIFALSRLVRFVLQGIIFFNVLNVDAWMV